MLLLDGKLWLIRTWADRGLGPLNAVVLGDSAAVIAENQIGIQGNVLYDSTVTYTPPQWTTAVVLFDKGASHSPVFADNVVAATVTLTNYLYAQPLNVREVVFTADGIAVSRILPTPFTIYQGDDVLITWILEFKDDLSDRAVL